jgi:hypothetical protein
MRRGEGNGFPENDRGTGPATPVSPAPLADESNQPDKFQAMRAALSTGEAIEAKQQTRVAGLGAVDEDDAEEIEIEQTFRRMLMSLRRLPRHQRAGALRAAREWRRTALKELREKRAREHRATRALQQFQRPAPG